MTAGLDVHRDMVMACLMWGAANGEAQWKLHHFGTTAPELQRLKSWGVPDRRFKFDRSCPLLCARRAGPLPLKVCY